MSKSFPELLTPKIVIVNTKRLENEPIMIQKNLEIFCGQHSNFEPLKFSLDPLNLGFAVPIGSGKKSVGPLEFFSLRYAATPAILKVNFAFFQPFRSVCTKELDPV